MAAEEVVYDALDSVAQAVFVVEPAARANQRSSRSSRRDSTATADGRKGGGGSSGRVVMGSGAAATGARGAGASAGVGEGYRVNVSAEAEIRQAVADGGGFLPLFDGEEDAPFVEARRRAASHCWSEIDWRVKDLFRTMNVATFDAVAKFFKEEGDALRVQAELVTALDNGSRTVESAPPYFEVPTALIHAGISVPDHDEIFSQLTMHVQRAGVCGKVALLRATDCTTVGSALSALTNQFIGELSSTAALVSRLVEWYAAGCPDPHSGIAEEEDETSSEDGESDDERPAKRSRTNNGTARPSPRSTARSTATAAGAEAPKVAATDSDGNNLPIVVILEDFESMSPSVVADLVAVFSSHQHHLPIVLVLGLATAYDAVHRLLPHGALRLLRTEKFQMKRALDYLEVILEEVLMSRDIFFKLGYAPAQFLVENFLLNNFSVTTFLEGLHFAVIEHFYDNPLSYLCVSLAVDENGDPVASISKSDRRFYDKLALTADHIQCIRELPSYKAFVDSVADEDLATLLGEDTGEEGLNATLGHLEMWIEAIARFHSTWMPALDVVETAFRDMPNRMKRREMYLRSLQTGVAGAVWFESRVETMMMVSIPNLVVILANCAGVLAQTAAFADQHASLTQLLQRAKDAAAPRPAAAAAAPSDSSTGGKDFAGDGGGGKGSKSRVLRERKIRTKESRRAALIGQHSVGTQVANSLKSDVVAWFRQFASTFLHSYTALPCHEVCYYTKARPLIKSFNAHPRTLLLRALTNPRHYLACSCCETSGALSNTMHDSCVAYQILEEGGRMVSLRDWFDAFAGIVSESRPALVAAGGDAKSPKTKSKGKKKKAGGKGGRGKGKRAADPGDESDDDGGGDEAAHGGGGGGGGDNSGAEASDDGGDGPGKKRKKKRKRRRVRVQAGGRRGGAGDGGGANPEHLARFAEAVRTLQYLGFIKTTTRKTDHVLRLAY